MDIKKILGDSYKEDMTVEELMKALEEVEIEPATEPKANDNSELLAKLKASVSKANSEAADYKRQLKAKMSEAEAAELEMAEKQKLLETELEELRNKSKLSELTAKYVALGYDEKLATETAKAFVDGDTDTVFANSQKHLEAVKKEAQTKALDNTPKPKGSTKNSPDITQEKFADMNYTQRAKLAEENPELYEKLDAVEAAE